MEKIFKEKNTKPVEKKISRVIGRIALILFIGLSFYLFISTTILIFLTKSGKEVEIPHVVGKRFVDVYNSIDRIGLKPEVSFYNVFDIDNGIILNQHPEFGSIASEGSKLKLVISRSNLYIDIPGLIGLRLPFAINKLKNLHVHNRSLSMGVGVISYIPSDKTKNNIVIDQSPRAGEEVTPDKKINLLVSSGKLGTDMKMPGVVGQSIDLCFDLLLAKGLNIYEEIKKTGLKTMSGIVMAQTPRKGTVLQKGDRVKLKVWYYPLKERPYISYERIDYKISYNDDEKNKSSKLFEAYIEDDRSKRIRFSRKMKDGGKMSFIFKRSGNAKVNIIYQKRTLDVLGINVEEFQ